jgi:hypothetical protein
MIWRSARKSRNFALPPEKEHRWVVVQAAHQGEPVIIRYNETIREWVGHPELPIRLGFAVPLNRPNQGGLPDPDENAALRPIEDLILREVSRETRGVFVLTLTDGVMKEWVFYVAPGADLAKLHQGIRSQVSSHDVQCMAIKDPEWASYRAFVPR